jgi:hypothetical protein
VGVRRGKRPSKGRFSVLPGGFGGSETAYRARSGKFEWDGPLAAPALAPGYRQRVSTFWSKRLILKIMKEGKGFVNMSKMK